MSTSIRLSSPICSEIAVREPAQIIAEVKSVAGACHAIVTASAMKIQGRSYIKVEGWQAIAAAHGCTASADLVEAVDGGIRSVATIRRLTDGAILGQAEGFVGDDESMWAKRPLYARRAMAQTRAISRACRSAFAHVVVAMNSGHGTDLSTTPAEEVPEGEFDDAPRGRQRPAEKPADPTPKSAAWHPDQVAEAKALEAEIVAFGAGAKAEAAAIKAKAKTEGAAATIDALATCLRQWQDAAGGAQ